MSRPLRLEFAGALYHITSRGNERKAIYKEESDFGLFIEVLEHVCERFNWVVHAYCLMTNHYHLLVETPDANLSKGMRQLNGIYTQKFNKKYKRVGHLYQGRYKSILVDKDDYLLELARYIVLNPVRAKGMVDHPQEWQWSSYHETVGLRPMPEWLASNALLLMFSKQKETAIKRYKEFVEQGIGKDVWQDIKSQVYLGNDEFVEQHKLLAEKEVDTSISEIPKKQTRAKAKPLSYYKNRYGKEPQRAMTKAYLTGQYTMSEIANTFSVHYSTVSRAIAKCKT